MTRSRDSRILAYVVTARDEEESVAVFDRRAVGARRRGASQLDQEFAHVSCRRAPEFDSFADQGEVPDQALLEAGWFLNCTGCQRRITLAEQQEASTDLAALLYHGRLRFCSAACLERHTRQQQEKNDKEARVRRALQVRFPAARVSAWYPGTPPMPGLLVFGLDGVGEGLVYHGHGEVVVPEDLRPAWDALIGSGRGLAQRGREDPDPAGSCTGP